MGQHGQVVLRWRQGCWYLLKLGKKYSMTQPVSGPQEQSQVQNFRLAYLRRKKPTANFYPGLCLSNVEARFRIMNAVSLQQVQLTGDQMPNFSVKNFMFPFC